MMDIDYLKKINDTHGHHVGDVVLKAVATIAKEQVGDSGVIGRYGGEEFLIILPDFSLNNANKIGELIRRSIEEYRYPIIKDVYGKVTVSLGIYEFTKKDESLIDGLKKADKALYKAKAIGKNVSVNYI